MKPSEYIAILQSKVIIDKDIAASLEAIIEEYPFFQSSRAVYLKYLHEQGSFRYNSTLKLTAAYTLDRSVLFNYITSDAFKPLENITPSWVLPVQENIQTATVLDEPTVEDEFEVIEDILDEHSEISEYIKEIVIEGIDVIDSEEVVIDKEVVSIIPELVVEDVYIENKIETETVPEIIIEDAVADEVENIVEFEVSEPILENTITTNNVQNEIIPLVEDDVEEVASWKSFNSVKEEIVEETPLVTIFEQPEVIEPEQPKEIISPIEEKLEIGKPLQFSKSEKHSFQEWLQLTSMKPIIRDIEIEPEPEISENIVQEAEVQKNKKMDLIDRFIKINPRMPKATAYDSAEKTNIVTRTDMSNSLMTETLAQVYLEQKKYDKAIQAYEILILKYPEKSTFFAHRIHDVKILQQNNNKK